MSAFEAKEHSVESVLNSHEHGMIIFLYKDRLERNRRLDQIVAVVIIATSINFPSNA